MDKQQKRTTYSLGEETNSQWVYLDLHPENSPRLGVSLSGGGIRSAAFSMGAMQRLVDLKIFGRIKHLAAVSGGTYIAGAMSITHATSKSESVDSFPWTHGSPEERKLRLETTYLANGVRDSFWLISNFLYGLFLNLLTLAIPMFVVGTIVGLIVSPFMMLEEGQYRFDDAVWPFLQGTIAVLLILAFGFVGFRRYRDKATQGFSSRSVAKLQNWNAGAWYVISFVVALAFLPYVLTLVHLLAAFMENVVASQYIRIIVAVSMMITFALVGGLALWLGRVTRKPRYFSPVAMIAGPGLLFTPFLVASDSVMSDYGGKFDHSVALVIGILATSVCSIVAHNRRYSLHLFYRERLQKAFGIKRMLDHEGQISAKSISYNKEIFLSQIGMQQKAVAPELGKFPNVIYCASVAASRSEAPYRHNASSYTFEADWCGGPLLGYTRTEELEKERGAGGTEITIPSIMAISGAAVSPMMGRFSEPPLRFLMAMLNLRLGVWLPHPEKIGPYILGGVDRLAMSLKERATSSSGKDLPSKFSTFRTRLATFLYNGWIEPGPLYVIYEALGRAKARGKYVYVSDGGHWENLGLVELLRRRCSHIIIIDASAPGRKLNEELARAARLANSELGVEIEIDLSGLENSESGSKELPESPCAKGKIIYPDGKEGVFIFIRSMLWQDAPFELKAFRDQDSLFPHHPTTNQFFSGEQFDAYRQLGWAAAKYVETMQIPEPNKTSQVGAEILT